MLNVLKTAFSYEDWLHQLFPEMGSSHSYSRHGIQVCGTVFGLISVFLLRAKMPGMSFNPNSI